MNVNPTNVKELEKAIGHLLELENYEEALLYLDQAILLDPNSAMRYSNKALILISLQRYEEALKASDQSLRLSPDDPVALLNKSSALIHLRRFEEAISICDDIILLKPQEKVTLFTYINKFLAFASLQRVKEAEETYKHIQHDPRSLKIINSLRHAIAQNIPTGKLEIE